jgi:epoxyqueuosine reductase
MNDLRIPPMTEWLRQRAEALGFSKVGIATCEPFDSERQHLEDWLRDGGAEHLPYLKHPDLLDPGSLLPGALSAVVGFFPYARPEAIPGKTPDSARLSRYIWGPDYHMLLKSRLKQLLLEAQGIWPELEGRACVDTAPLLERQLAVRAGLGWQGKHTLLITGRGGSWGFLGVLLLNAELEPDSPFKGHHCGTCTACLDACPTGALSPFRLAPNRCITTFNLETEAEPPDSVASAIHDTRWIAGCDRCQEVCPWNRIPVWGDPELWGGTSPLHTRPLSQLTVNGSQYRKLIAGTSLRRVRHRHWLRMLRMLRMLDHGIPCKSP